MPINRSRRLSPQLLRADLDTLAALKMLTTYAPANSAYAVASIEAIKEVMASRQDDEVQANAHAATTRDGAVAAEWGFHEAVIGAKTAVEAQYGPDSDEIQMVGNKRKSEYARPTGRKSGNTGSGQ